MNEIVWGAGLLFGFVLLWLLDRREKWVREKERELRERLEKRVIHALVVVGVSIPIAYWLPRLGVELDPADIVAGSVLSALSWVITGEIREGL